MKRRRAGIKEMNIFDRIAFSDLETIRKAQAFLNKWRIKKATNQQDLSDKLAFCIEEYGEAIIPEFLELHPDIHYFKDHLSDMCKTQSAQEATPAPKSPESKLAESKPAMMNADGDNQSSNTAAPAKAAQEQASLLKQFNIMESMPMIVFAGVFCITLVAITRTHK